MHSSQPSKLICYKCKKITSTKTAILISSWDSKYKLTLNRVMKETKGIDPPLYGPDNYLCVKCGQEIMNGVDRPSSSSQPSSSQEQVNWNEKIFLIKRCFSAGQSRCLVCRKNANLVEFPKWAKVMIYIECNIFVHKRSRCCENHLANQETLVNDCKKLPAVFEKIELSQQENYDWEKLVLESAKELDTRNNIFSFHQDTSYSDEDYKIIIGVNKSQFEELCSILVDKTYEGRKCSRKNLGMFLMKLRQNLSDDYLKVMFRYKNRQNVSRIISLVRILFMQYFVPLYLGPKHILRQVFINRHNTPLVNRLYFKEGQEKAVLIVDATYLYIEKSSNYTILKRSFSVHKGRHLIKPTMIVGSDGYILDVLGPHMADGSNNDAKILMSQLKKETSELKKWLDDDDVFIVDRGYRDCLSFLEDLGLITHMPHFMKKGQKQHSTEEANESRLVTVTRWIVEKKNGDVKQIFKFLDGVVKTAHLSTIGDFFKIGCALLNAFYPTIQLKEDPIWMSEQLLERARKSNHVQGRVERDKLKNSKKSYVKMSEAEIRQFPFLSESDLREVTLGSYQLSQAKHYVAEKQLRDGQFEFELCKEDASVESEEGEKWLRARIWSRHKTQAEYKIWIHYNEKKFGSDSVLGWYCTCPAGARTVGACAHVTATLWWIAHERGVTNVDPAKVPSAKVLGIIEDAAERNVDFPTLIDEQRSDDEN